MDIYCRACGTTVPRTALISDPSGNLIHDFIVKHYVVTGMPVIGIPIPSALHGKFEGREEREGREGREGRER